MLFHQTRIFETPVIRNSNIETRSESHIINDIRSRDLIVQTGTVADVGMTTQCSVYDIVITYHIELKCVLEVRESIGGKAVDRCHESTTASRISTTHSGRNRRPRGQIHDERSGGHQP